MIEVDMQHVTGYYIDARDGRPATEAPLRHGPALPSAALVVDAVDRRKTPALIIGHMPADEPLGAGMSLISETEHTALMDDYQAWRDTLNQQWAEKDSQTEPQIIEFTYKTDVWRRCTDDEAEQLDGALQDSSVRTRRMWDDCLTLEHDSELFDTLTVTMTNAFGEERTNELLAPSVREGVV